jgi:hypothetical protein
MRGKRVVGAVTLLSAVSGCGGEVGEATDTIGQAMVGAVASNNTGPHVNASGFLTINNTDGSRTGCSGTLVAPNQVLLAAHCVRCGDRQAIACTTPPDCGFVQFANLSGTLSSASPKFPIAAMFSHPSSVGLCTEDGGGIPEKVPFDIAVATILPVPGGTLPTITPVPLHLDFDTFLQAPAWVVGYGTPTVGTRMSGIMTPTPVSKTENCGDPFDFDCWDDPLWAAPSRALGSNIDLMAGDSGGGLFFNVTSTTARVAGVRSGELQETTADAQRWAKTNLVIETAPWLFQRVGLSPHVTLADQRANGTIYARGAVHLNDRAHVMNSMNQNETQGGSVVVNSNAGPAGTIFMSTDTVAGTLWARNRIELRDRATVTGDVHTYLSAWGPGQGILPHLVLGNNVRILGQQFIGQFMQFEDFGLTIPWSSSTTAPPIEIRNDVVGATIAPGRYSSVTFRARSETTLRHGVYVFRSWLSEPDSRIFFDTFDGPVWVYIDGNTYTEFKGTFIGEPTRILFGFPVPTPQTPNVGIGLYGQWKGTLVAPHGVVTGDMSAGATLDGTFFPLSFLLHQGRYVRRAPFIGPWVPACAPGSFTNCN